MSGGIPSFGLGSGSPKVGVKKQGLAGADAPGTADASKQWLESPPPPGNAVATVKYNGASNEPGISDAERIRRKRSEAGPGQLVPDDLADLALRDASSGKVRKVRGGSTRESILGSALGDY